MSVITSKYENNIDRCWYDSSNVVFSEMIDKPNDYKDVRVTFKDGRTYQYNKVTIQDYMLFKADISQGKALSKYLASKSPLTGKLKYECQRLDDVNIQLLTEEKNNLILEQKMEKLNEENNG